MPSPQRGFVRGWNFLENVWRLDAQSRVATLDSAEALPPLSTGPTAAAEAATSSSSSAAAAGGPQAQVGRLGLGLRRAAGSRHAPEKGTRRVACRRGVEHGYFWVPVVAARAVRDAHQPSARQLQELLDPRRGLVALVRGLDGVVPDAALAQRRGAQRGGLPWRARRAAS